MSLGPRGGYSAVCPEPSCLPSAPWAWGELYKHSGKGPIAHFSKITHKILSLKLYKLFEEFNPDIVISTHPFSSQMTTILKEQGKTDCKLATVMTDFASHDQWLVRT